LPYGVAVVIFFDKINTIPIVWAVGPAGVAYKTLVFGMEG
jgi:hypothetical protein